MKYTVEYWSCLILSGIYFNGTVEHHDAMGVVWFVFAVVTALTDYITSRND